MSNRTVAVVLKAQVDDYVKNMQSAARHTTDVEKAARSATEQFRIHNESLTKVGTAMGAVGVAAAAGLAVAVKASADYGAKMAQLQSLSHATTHEMQQLSDAAMKQGTAFGFSATQVADAQIELNKAGRSSAQILGGDLKGALALAAAGQMDVAEATQIGVTALTQFASSGATIPKVADSLAAGADKALGSVSELGMALQQGGLVASQMGLDLDDTVGTLSAFAQAGLIGSDAGTSFKTMLLSLQSPSKQAQAALDQYNISAYDAKGNFVGIADLAGQLKSAFAGQSQSARDAALSTIFGTDAIRAANVLYTQGETGIKKWIAAVDDTGFASAQAAGKMDSLEGDLQKLSAAFQTDLIKAGQSGDSAFRGITQSGTALLTMLGDMNPGLISVATGATTVVAAVGLLGGAALVAVPKIAAMKLALQELNLSGKAAALTFAKGAALTVGLTAVASGFAGLAQQGTASAQQVSLAGDSIKTSWKGLDGLFATTAGSTAGLKDALSMEGFDSGWFKFIDSASFGLAHLSDVYKTNEGQFDAMGKQLAGLAQQDYGRASQSFAGLVKQYGLGQDEAAKLLALMPDFRDELIHQADAAHVSATDHNLLLIAQGKGAAGAKVLAAAQKSAAESAAAQAEGIAKVRGEANSAQGSIEDLANTIAGFGSATLDARAAQRDFQQAIDDAKDAAKKAGDATKTSTKADRDKQAALDDVARSGIAVAAAYAKQPGGVKKAEQAMKDARSAFIDAATAMGIGKKRANELADAAQLIPENISLAVGVSGVVEAITNLKDLKQQVADVNGLRANIAVNLTTNGADALQISNYTRRAAGGPIDGPGPKGVDSVFAVLAPGEHVLTAAEVDRMGGQGAVSAFRQDLMGEVQAFAKGGAVQKHKAAPTIAAKPKKKAPSKNAIDQQKAIAAAADAAEERAQKAVVAQKKRAAAAQKAADKAQKKYESIDGTKKNRTAKKAAKDAAEAAKKRADAADKKVDDLRDTRDKAKDQAQAALDAAAQLRLDREDFVSAERRDPDRASTDPLAYVDQLRQMSRDDNYSDADRAKFKDQANQYEQALSDLTKQSQTAADNLANLKDSAKQLRDAVASAISGGYGLSNYVSEQAAMTTSSETGWFERDGVRYQSSSSTTGAPLSASSLAGFFAGGNAQSDQFADALQQLAGKGLNTSLLAELAQMGTAQGLPIAKAILAGSNDDFATINAGYQGIAAAGARAGGTVSDATYSKQIADADQHLQEINATLTADGEKLRHLIATAFGVPGYALGTSAATEGLHWVGEHGPELVGLRAGTPVGTAAQSERWVRGGGFAAQAPTQVTVQAPPVVFPETLLLQDAHGFEAQFRVIAQQAIDDDAAQDAVLMVGTGTL